MKSIGRGLDFFPTKGNQTLRADWPQSLEDLLGQASNNPPYNVKAKHIDAKISIKASLISPAVDGPGR